MRSVLAWYRCRPLSAKRRIRTVSMFAAVFFVTLVLLSQMFITHRDAKGFTTDGGTLSAIYALSAILGFAAMGVFEIFVRQPSQSLLVFLRARLKKTDRDRIKLGKLQARQARKTEKTEASQKELQESVQDFLTSAERLGSKHGLNVLESSLLAYELLNDVQARGEKKAVKS